MKSFFLSRETGQSVEINLDEALNAPRKNIIDEL
jgi:hypothetical protein